MRLRPGKSREKVHLNFAKKDNQPSIPLIAGTVLGGANTMSNIHQTALAYDIENDNIVSPLEIQDDSCFNNDENPGTRTHQIDKSEEAVWKILSKAFKGWFAIWVLFAIIIISAELTSSSGHKSSSVHNISLPAAREADAQTLLHTAEEITDKCSFSNIKTETGRSDCQRICWDHSCCFSDEEERYGCKDDPEKMCSVYIGCETLFGQEVDDFDSATHDQDEINNIDSNTSEAHNLPVNNQTETIEVTPQQIDVAPQQMDVAHQTTSAELELVAHVITAVCSNDNLHTSHGLHECVELCNPSMCCFNRTEIEARSPHMDIVLRLEGVTDEMIDRSVMGTCMAADETTAFCQVHSGCKNLLLIGSSKNRDAFSTDYNSSVHLNDENPQHAVVTILVFFGFTIGLASYMLICNRLRLLDRSEFTERDDLVNIYDSGDII